MKIEYKCLSKVDEFKNPMFLVTVRTERHLLVTRESISVLLNAGNESVKAGHIEDVAWYDWEKEFTLIQRLLSQMIEAPLDVREAQLSTDWRPFPSTNFADVERLMLSAFGQRSFLSLSGEAPNFSLDLNFGASSASFPIPPSELKATQDFLSAVDENMIEAAALRVRNRSATPKQAAEELAVALAVGAVATGGVVLVAVGVASVAAGAVTAAAATTAVIKAVEAVTAALAAYTAYTAYKALEEQKRLEEAKAKEQETRGHIREASGVRDTAAGGPAFEQGLRDIGSMA